MANLHCDSDQALLVVVDIQPKFMAAIHESDRVVRRSLFIAKASKALDIPVLATVQNPDRMGGFDERFLPLLEGEPSAKMAFSCWNSEEFQKRVEASERTSIVLVGIETHICVTLTALDLLQAGYRVFVCPDAVSSRSMEMHKLGMERIRDSGGIASHTETLVYEWMRSAEHPRFREVLQIVKDSASSQGA